MAVVAIVCCAFAGTLRADDVDPWTRDVPMDKQDEANAVFAEGNERFAEEQHAPAIERYRAAISIWDHPMIRYNLAITLIRVGQLLEAAEQLDLALQYGERPFPTKPRYREALDYHRLLAGQLGYIHVTCGQPGVKVLLDGRSWLECPGTRKQRVVVGEHALVAEHPLFVTRAIRSVVQGGATVSQDITLQSLEDAVQYTYPYRRWIPWSVIGTGATVSVIGAVVWGAGRNKAEDTEARSIMVCGAGCTDEERAAAGLDDDFASATLQRRIGIGMLIGGVVVSATGAYFAITNRPTRVLPKVDVSPRSVVATWQF
ncbi:MAG: hypothetical protein ACKV2T_43980 [Kofleriaceae bacterium]